MNLGSSGLRLEIAGLTYGGVALDPWLCLRSVSAVPRGTPQDLAHEWHDPSSEPPRMKLDLGTRRHCLRVFRTPTRVAGLGDHWSGGRSTLGNLGINAAW
jgi:hypothetical protein